MVQPVLRVTVVHRVLKATKERRAQLEPQVLGVHAVRRVAKANRVLKVQQACKDQPERPALLVPQEHWSL